MTDHLTITISGPQGSGKTILAGALMRLLDIAGVDAVINPDEEMPNISNASLLTFNAALKGRVVVVQTVQS